MILAKSVFALTYCEKKKKKSFAISRATIVLMKNYHPVQSVCGLSKNSDYGHVMNRSQILYSLKPYPNTKWKIL